MQKYKKASWAMFIFSCKLVTVFYCGHIDLNTLVEIYLAISSLKTMLDLTKTLA